MKQENRVNPVKTSRLRQNDVNASFRPSPILQFYVPKEEEENLQTFSTRRGTRYKTHLPI